MDENLHSEQTCIELWKYTKKHYASTQVLRVPNSRVFFFFFFLTNSFLARRLAVAATGVATVDLTPNRTKSLNPKLDFLSSSQLLLPTESQKAKINETKKKKEDSRYYDVYIYIYILKILATQD